MPQFNPVKKALASLIPKYKKQLSILKEMADEQIRENEQPSANKEYEEKLELFKQKNAMRVELLKEDNNWSNHFCHSFSNDKNYKYNELSFNLDEINKTTLNLNVQEKVNYLDSFPIDAIHRFPEYKKSEAEKSYKRLGVCKDIELQMHQEFLNEYEDYLKVYFPEMYHFYTLKLNEFNSYLNARIKFYNGEGWKCRTGLYGEQSVKKELDIHDNIVNMQNIRIEINGESSENDVIILSTRGIFSLEVKNYAPFGEYSILIEPDGCWKAIYPDGEIKILEQNPQGQSTRHIAFLNRLINSYLGRNLDNFIEAKDIIVIPNDKVMIENRSQHQIVLRKSEIYNFVQHHPIVFNEWELNEIKNIIEQHNLGPQRYDFLDFKEELFSNIDTFRKKMSLIKKMVESSYKDFEKLKAKYNQEESA